jgi:Iap family predicted aminopeptidase
MLVRTRAQPRLDSPPVNLVETLGVEIGVRQAGTPAAARAAEAVADAFASLGLEPRFHEFELLGYEADEPELEIEGERWDAGPCMYANPTDGAVEGRIRRLGSHSIGGFFPLADVFAVEDDEGLELTRLCMSPFGGAAIPFLTDARQIAVGPTVFISGRDSERLRAMEGAQARVRVSGRFVPGRRERNVVAELRGASDEAIVVSAHYDSVWRGPGVVDNATGIEGIRRLAERFAGGGHARSLVFVGFAAEEIGCIGSRQYIWDAEVTGELDRLKACVNLDCIAHGDRFELNASPPALLERAERLARELDLHRRYDISLGPASPGVDAFPFHEKGIPSVSLSHFPYAEYHLPSEQPALIDEQKMADSVEVAARLLEGLLDDPVARASDPPNGRPSIE